MEMTKAAEDVLAERRRQIEVEGFTTEHDDKHTSGEIARAAGCYAFFAATPKPHVVKILKAFWPWDEKWLKPKSPRQDLVDAGALILAEIERLDRAEASNVAS